MTNNELQHFHRAISRVELRNSIYQIEQCMIDMQLYYSLKAEIPQFGVFMAHLEYIGAPELVQLSLERCLEKEAHYSKFPLEYIRSTTEEEYLSAAFTWISSMANIKRFFMEKKYFREFSSMENLFPGWDAMEEACRDAMYCIINKADNGIAEIWAAGCEDLEQLQRIVNSIGNNFVKN